MKKIIFGCCLVSASLLICTAAGAMDPVKVPMKVKAVFHHEYKDAQDVRWTMRDRDYTVSFRKDGTREMAQYDWTGHRLDTRVAVPENALPDKVVSHLDKKYHGNYSHSGTLIERPWKKDLYMVNVHQKGKSVPVYMDKKGHEHGYARR
ncbi:MAG TPA: hypothetical protein VKU83_10070 [Puia sp.]|nr:hypothetical protein [Puia sp.]